MKERLGCLVVESAGCLVNATIVEFDGAYNKVMSEEIQRIHGAEAEASVLEEAKGLEQIRYDEWFRKNPGR